MLGVRILRQSDNKPDVYKPDLSFMDDFNPENSKREQHKNKENLAVMNKEKKLCVIVWKKLVQAVIFHVQNVTPKMRP